MSAHKTVKVDLGDRSYEIVVGKGLLATCGEKIARALKTKNAIIITDLNVADAGHLQVVMDSLNNSNIKAESIILPPGEQTKSFAELEELLNKLLSIRPDRNVVLVALGGGVIGDITGFAASILLRGVNFVQIPTTLLAMVDSSVGGKTGINTKFGKNLVGSFYQPKLVIADIDTLDTLPSREFGAGYAEMVKYGLINSPEFFATLESKGRKIGIEEIAICCESKAEIVSADEKEAGQRALLNLGHTFGHALETETGYSDKLLHGEAVAIGMVMAFSFSDRLGLCSSSDSERVRKFIKSVDLPSSVADIKGAKLNPKKLLEHIRQIGRAHV